VALAPAIARRWRAARGDRAEVGVIADTHGLMRDEALAALRGVARIVHAGDVGAPAVLEALSAIAPVTAVRGNNDRGSWARRLPERATLAITGMRILVLHDRKELAPADLDAGIRVVVSGHSHRPLVEESDGTLFVNPGSAGPRRFALPVAVARISIAAGAARARIVVLA
jgi:putative phosphoesterase